MTAVGSAPPLHALTSAHAHGSHAAVCAWAAAHYESPTTFGGVAVRSRSIL